MRETVRALVEGIVPFDVQEAANRQAALEWVDSGAELFRLKKPATPPQHLVSYFIVMDGPAVLLGDHLLSGLWLPSGGHVEPGEHPQDTARREAMEELSITAEFLADTPQFLTIEETVGQTAGHWDVSLWYVLKGDRGRRYDFDRREYAQIGWFQTGTLPQNTEPNLGRFLAKWAARA